jgi:hypothetical protein
VGTGILYGASMICAALAVVGPFLNLPRLTRRSAAAPVTPEAVPLFFLLLAMALAALLGHRVGSFYKEHWSGFNPGSVPYSAADELAQYHGTLLISSIVAIVANVRHHWRAPAAGRLLAGSAGMGAAILAAAAMVITLPRSGDEGLILWIVLAPAAGLSMLVLFIVSIRLVTGWARHRHELEPEPPGPPLCPSCAYQLTGNVSGTCPECGSPVPQRLRPRLATPVPSAQYSQARPDRAALLALAAGCACILLSILGSAMPMVRLVPLPGLSTFLIWRVEPWWLGLAMGSAIIAAAKALPDRRKWSLAVCIAWAFGNMALGVINIAHAMPLWHRVPPSMFSARRFVPWLALLLTWSFVVPLYMLLTLRTPASKSNS